LWWSPSYQPCLTDSCSRWAFSSGTRSPACDTCLARLGRFYTACLPRLLCCVALSDCSRYTGSRETHHRPGLTSLVYSLYSWLVLWLNMPLQTKSKKKLLSRKLKTTFFENVLTDKVTNENNELTCPDMILLSYIFFPFSISIILLLFHSLVKR